MLKTLTKTCLFSLLILVIFSTLTRCKKKQDEISQDILQQYFDTNILNRDFKVKLATDNGSDLTSNYTGYVFRLLKTTNYDGPMTAKRNDSTYTGTWSTNEDFSKLTITITQPFTPQSFFFLNRSWRFTKKALPVMELAPWGNTTPLVLHMERL